MPLKAINPTQTKAWNKLSDHFKDIHNKDILSFFETDAKRVNKLSISWEDFYVDFSKNRINDTTVKLLLELTNELELKDAIQKYFDGDVINQTEERAVLHTALRASEDAQVYVDGLDVIPEIQAVREKIKNFSNSVIEGKHLGYTGKAINTIVNIGIGGSDLGPAMVVDALSFYQNHLTTYFVSNVDGDHVAETLKKLNPETTLFVIVSKTFTTQETISNASTIRSWFLNSGSEEDIAKHFVAVSTNIGKVKEFGIHEDNIFPMWDWVGGRFSLWSAVGLSISLSVGYNNFASLLEGAREMDSHFKNTEFFENIPVIAALLSVWYNNFFEAESQAVIAYSQYLNQFATYLQQGIMESNGKGVDRAGNPLNYQSGTIIWGEPGTNSQHAFFQLIHQGTKIIPADFIGFKKSLHGNKDHHDKLMSNFFAQTEALLKGKSSDEVKSEMAGKPNLEKVLPYKVFTGNRPTTTFLIDKLTPNTLGKLIAMYEHKIFVEGVIWNIYSYDQFGVELGKQLAGTILEEFEAQKIFRDHDPSTAELLKSYIDS